jgi:hypothetical protein
MSGVRGQDTRMESDLRTSAARLRAGLDNLSAIPPTPGTRPLPRTTAGQPRPLGAFLGGSSGDGGPASAVAESESAVAPRPERPRAGGGHRRRYVLRRKLEPLACWPAQYAKLPRRAWDDPRLHQGAKITLAVILCAARGRRQFHTYKRSLAIDARISERTLYNHLKLLEATGFIILWRASRRSPLLVRIADPALARHRPLPGWAEAGWALQRSRHPKAADALAAADRRLRRTHLALGLGPVGITIPTPRILTDSESPNTGGSGPGAASRRSGSMA